MKKKLPKILVPFMKFAIDNLADKVDKNYHNKTITFTYDLSENRWFSLVENDDGFNGKSVLVIVISMNFNSLVDYMFY